MAMEGTLKTRDGNLYVLYTSDEYGEPFRQYIWWRVLELRGTGYGERPEVGDIATSTSGGGWQTRNPSTHRSTGTVSTGTGSTLAETVERVSIPPPATGGKELRWRDGRWEKLLAKGWVPAGEGKLKGTPKAGTSPNVRHATKKPAQLDREIAEVLTTSRGARVLADLERWNVDREQIREVRDAFQAGDHRRALALARDLGWNRASKRGRGGSY